MAWKCKKHPKYKVIKKPRSTCGICWDIWNTQKRINAGEEWYEDIPAIYDIPDHYYTPPNEVD